MNYEEAATLLPQEAEVFTQEDLKALPKEQQEQALKHIKKHKRDEELGSKIRTFVLVSGITAAAAAAAIAYAKTTEIAIEGGLLLASGALFTIGYISGKLIEKAVEKQEAALVELKSKNKENGR